MKKHFLIKGIYTLICFMLFLINMSFGQNWKDQWKQNTSSTSRTFYESLADAEQYFIDNPTYIDTPQSGYKDYMRFYNFWRNKINSDGTYSEYPDALLNYINSTAATSHVSSEWSLIGPFTIPNAHGSHSNSRGMGWVNAIDVFPSQRNLMYAGSNSGGLYKSSNGGVSWSYIPFAKISLGIQSIAIDPNDSNIVYIATGTTVYQKEYGLGLFKTTDGGVTWTNIFTDPNNSTSVIQKVLVDPNNSSNIFIAFRGKIYKSTNGGSSFVQKLNVVHNSQDRNVKFHDLLFKPLDSNILYASGKELYKSINAGEDWYCITDSTTLSKDLQPKLSNSDFQTGAVSSFFGWSTLGNWFLLTQNSESYAAIKPTINVVSKLIEESHSESYYIPEDRYSVELSLFIPAYTSLKIKLYNKDNTDSLTVYEIIEQSSNRTLLQKFEFQYSNTNNWFKKITLEVTASNNYNNTDTLKIDYIKIICKTSDRIAIATTNQYPNKLYIGISYFVPSGKRYYAIEKSNDLGQHWKLLKNVTLDDGPLYNKFNLIVSPSDTNRQYIGCIQIRKTTSEWTSGSSKITAINGTTNRMHDDVRQLLVFDNSGSDEIYSANDGGVTKSLNSGVNWNDISNNLTVTQIFGIAGIEDKPNFILSGCQDLSTNFWEFENWKNTSAGDGYDDPLITPFNSNIIFSRANGYLRRSTNKFISFEDIDDASEATDLKYIINNYETKDYTIFAGVVYEVAGVKKYDLKKSNQEGADSTWTSISSSSIIGNSKILSFDVCESNPNYIYFAEEFAGSGAKIWRTTIGGGTSSGNWSDVTGSLPTLYAGITDIAVDPGNPNRVWVTFGNMSEGNKVYFRDFSLTGTNWVNFSDGIDNSKYNLPVNCIKYWKGSNDGLFIGTDVGVFYRDNSMSEWVEYNNGFHPTIIQDLEINNVDHKIRAGTFGRGLWESPLPECSYNSEAYLVEGPDTITTYTKMNRNVIVEDNGIFVVKSRLIMSNDTKITVKKGGKIVVDGGYITNTCGGMWDGIIIEGSRIEAQSDNTHGWCEVKNGGTIENARVAIKSYAGGVVRVIGGNFYNNRFGVSFNLYSLNNNGQHANLSVVANSKFICSKPMVDSNTYMDDGVREGSKSFVSIAQQDGIRVINNDFISTYRPRADLKGTGVVTWSCRSYIHNNDFTGLAFGIESGGYLNALQYNSVYNNEFKDVSLGITETAMAGSQIRENTISLPAYESNAWLMENYGIKLDVPRGFNVSNNSVGVPSTVTTNANTYGVLVKNSDTIPCNIEHNIFEKLQFANQLEGDNDVIGIQCNYYTESVQDWSINPITVGTIHDFGSDINTEIQASNYFPDDTSGSGVKNIRLNENMSFFYNSVSFPDTAKPKDNTNNVTVNVVDGTIYAEECMEPFDPCGGNPIPCVAYAQDLVNNNSEASSDLILKYKLNLAQQLRDSGMMEELRQMLEAETSSEWEELKLPIYIEYGESMGVNVQDLIDNLPSGDYKDFMQVILDIKNENIPIDSVGDIGLTDDIFAVSEGSSPISNAAKKILELFFNYQYVREAERWEESSMVVHNNDTSKVSLNLSTIFEINDNREKLESEEIIKPDFLLLPNPSDGNFVIKLISSASGVVYIIDMHGKIISQVELSKNETMYIEKGSVTPGVYNIRLLNSTDSYQLNKRIVILE